MSDTKHLSDNCRMVSPKKAPLCIHVNSHNIRSNRNHGEHKPVIVVRHGKGSVAIYCDEVELTGKSRVVYGSNKPMSCGAEVWMETNEPIICKWR